MLKNSREIQALDKKKYNLKFLEKNIDNAFASTYTRKGACECIVFMYNFYYSGGEKECQHLTS